MLSELALKPSYSSDETNLLADFYIPVLGEAIRYDRAVGYFSSSALSYAFQGMDRFVRNNGVMRLLIGTELDDDEYEAVKEGHYLKELQSRLGDQLQEIASVDNELLSHRLRLLCFLVAHERLTIKIALRRRGMFHEKIGYMEDSQGNALAFQGSANETPMALMPESNGESISVYPSWNRPVFEAYAIPIRDRFERLWNGETKSNVVVPLPSELYEKLRSLRNASGTPPEIEADLYRLAIGELASESSGPRLPFQLGSEPYELKAHQRAALEAWRGAGFQGIFALATGAGKTITALHAAVQIADARWKQASRKSALVIAVPYQVLADQWCEVMRIFNIEAVPCYRSKAHWKATLDAKIADFMLYEDKRFLAAVVVNATLATEDFATSISKIQTQQLIFIGDECHHHANERVLGRLPPARYRIGLSATPWSRSEDEKQALLKSFYGNIVSEYSISEALRDGVLSPYDYRIHTIRLTAEESDQYEDLSASIGKLQAIKLNGGKIKEEQLRALLMARARLIGSAENKFSCLESILADSPPEKHTLFYCGDGSTELEEYEGPKRDVQRVAQILHRLGWKTSRVTAEESLQTRRTIIEEFRDGFIDAMVAIRVLDEGFDIPSCRQAFLLASSRNERQFIQRRGRILRLAPGKEFATIHDFLVMPSTESSAGGCFQELVKKELLRGLEFAKSCRNQKDVIYELGEIAAQFQLDLDDLSVAELEEDEF